MMFTNNAIHIEDSDGEEQNDINGINEDYETCSENWYTKDEELGVWQEDDDTLIFDESITSDDQVMVTTELQSLSLENHEPTNNDDKQTQVSLTVSHIDGGVEVPSSLEHKPPKTTAIPPVLPDLASQQELTIRSQEGSRSHYPPPPPSQQETKPAGLPDNSTIYLTGPTREKNEDGLSQMSRPPPGQQQLYLVGSRPDDDAPTEWGSSSIEPTWGKFTQQIPDVHD
jgi:hypothetical protein